MLDPDELREQMSTVQGFVSKLAYPACVALEKNQNKLSEQQRTHNDRVDELKKGHAVKVKPLYAKRDKILKEKSMRTVLEMDEEGQEVEAEVPEIGVPGFWLRVLKGCDECDKSIKDRDEECLAALTNVEWDVKKPSSEGEVSATLKLHFAPNEFFKNKILTKDFPNLVGEDIEWKEGKNLTRKSAGGGGKKGKKGGGDDNTKAAASFFQLFSTPDAESRHVEQQIEMIKEIAGTVRDSAEDSSAFELFLGAYGDATEFLEGVELEPENFEECYQSDVVKERIRRLADVYNEIDTAVSADAKAADEETLKLESLCEALYTERAKIIDGDAATRPPRFWLQVLLNSDTATHFAGERDDRILKFVKDISAKTDSTGTSTVTMSLWENPYLNTTTLSRSINADGSTEGTTVLWKDDANGDSMQYKTVKRGKFGKAISSIIWGFDDEKGALSPEEIETLHHSFVEEVVPNALCLYIRTPDALEDDDDDEDDDESFDGEEEEEEDDEEDDESEDGSDDEDRVRKVVASKSKKKRKGGDGEESSMAGGNLLMLFLLMILSSQVVSFFM
jgi:hypothetical protein